MISAWVPLPTQYQPLLLNLKRVSNRLHTEPSCHCLALPRARHPGCESSRMPSALCCVPLAAPEPFSSGDSTHCPARIPSSRCAGATAAGFNTWAFPAEYCPVSYINSRLHLSYAPRGGACLSLFLEIRSDEMLERAGAGTPRAYCRMVFMCAYGTWLLFEHIC